MENYLHSFNIFLVYFLQEFHLNTFPTLYIAFVPQIHSWLEVFIFDKFVLTTLPLKCYLNNSFEKLLRELSWISYWINICGMVSRIENKAKGMILLKTKMLWLSDGVMATFLAHPWDCMAHIQYQFTFLVILIGIWCGSIWWPSDDMHTSIMRHANTFFSPTISPPLPTQIRIKS